MADAISKRFVFEGNTSTTVIASILDLFNVHVQPRMLGLSLSMNIFKIVLFKVTRSYIYFHYQFTLYKVLAFLSLQFSLQFKKFKPVLENSNQRRNLNHNIYMYWQLENM